MSFGGRLAQIRAIRARNSERRAWSSAGEFDRVGCALAGPEDKRAPSSRECFSRGERRGVGKHFSMDCSIVYVRQQRSKKGHKIESYPKTDAGIRDIDLDPALAALVKKYIGGRTSGFLFETSGGLPMSPRNIARDNSHPILKKMGRESAGFHTFRQFRESILQMSEARTLLIDFWMGHANGDMSERYGKQLLENVQGRRDCAAKVALGFTLPTEEEQPLMDKSGQVLKGERQEAVAA